MNFKKTVAIVAAAGALTALAIPAMAELTPYGSMRFQSFYQTYDPAAATTSGDTDINFDLAGNARLGIKGTTGDLGGVVEMGFNTGNTVYTRLMYATYKTSLGTLLVGQDYSNNWLTSAQVDRNDKGFSGYGALDNSRRPQIKFTMNNGVYFAAIKPGTPDSVAAVTADAAKYRLAVAAVDYDTILPTLNVGYKGAAGNFSYNAGALFQTFEQSTLNQTVTSYLGYVNGKMTAGPAAVIFNLGYGQNTGDMAIASGLAGATNKYVAVGDKNTKTIEGFVQGSFKASDMITVAAGVGYVSDDQDQAVNADNRMAFFVNAPITIAKGFTITPEFSYYDEMKSAAKADQDTRYAVGAKLQMDF